LFVKANKKNIYMHLQLKSMGQYHSFRKKQNKKKKQLITIKLNYTFERVKIASI